MFMEFMTEFGETPASGHLQTLVQSFSVQQCIDYCKQIIADMQNSGRDCSLQMQLLMQYMAQMLARSLPNSLY